MAINVTHSKVSTIPDGDDTSLIRPSDWNDDHVIVGLGTMAEQNANNVNITGGAISGVTIPASTLTGLVTVPQGGTGASTLTGYVKGSGTSALTASSTIPNTDITGLGTASTKDAGVALGVATLDASGKVPISEIPDAVIGALNYQGTWNATTNTPTLTSSVGTKGYYYVVSVAGTTDLNGVTDWLVGDWAVYNGTAWQKVDNTDGVTSVNGFTGAVVLTTTNIAEGTNEYFTTARARSSLSAGTGISYDSSTGVITNSSPSLGGDVVGPASATDNAIARFDTTTGKLIQNSIVTIDDSGNESGVLSQQFSNGSAVTLAAGKLWYDDSTGSFNMGMGGGNITQQVGEEIFIYGKASAAITEGQLICKTGTVGASGVITFAPSPANLTNNDGIIGIATENIALNAFGRITYFGVVHGINTTGASSGETWADNDTLWYNPAGGGLLTNVKPTAPNIKFEVATVINAGSGGSGSVQVLLNPGSTLGGTDSNVQTNGLTNGNILTYDGGNGYWKNTDLTAGTAISVSKSVNGVLTVTNTLPDQTVSITGAGTTTVTGTYPNFTVTSNDQYTGTVTSVAASVPSFLSVSGSPITTAGTLAISYSGTALPAANGGTGLTSPGTSGNVLTSDGTSWVSSAPTGINADQAYFLSFMMG